MPIPEAQRDVVRVLVTPHVTRNTHRDAFDVALDGEVIVTATRQPLFDSARRLLARGFDPRAMLTIRHAGAPHDSFVPIAVGEAAKWTVRERDRGGLRIERAMAPGESERLSGIRAQRTPDRSAPIAPLPPGRPHATLPG
jgi:hypothetical protein